MLTLVARRLKTPSEASLLFLCRPRAGIPGRVNYLRCGTSSHWYGINKRNVAEKLWTRSAASISHLLY